MTDRRWLYVAVSRCRTSCTIVYRRQTLFRHQFRYFADRFETERLAETETAAVVNHPKVR